ncbi:MAG: DHA2 family efflux MFS transporter permease subunit [Solirubrobacterales bacterium]|nr:DHA2 family efflux MFS transporter permease subunit [Solirubrobacterales bacterium]
MGRGSGGSESANQGAARPEASASTRRWTLAAVCLAISMLMVDLTVVVVALPDIQRDFGTSLETQQWTVNAYALAVAVFLVVGGRLGDIFGRRRLFLTGTVVFTCASALAAASADDTMLIGARILQGIGGALMYPATLSLVSAAFPPERRNQAVGIWAGVAGLSLASGPLLGGALTQIDWRWIFLINIPLGALTILLTVARIRESREEGIARTIDVPGFLTLGGGLTALVLALDQSNGWGWGSPAIIALLAAAVVLLVGFVVVESRAEQPLIDLSLFRSSTFSGALSINFIVQFCLMGAVFFLSLYLQNILGFDAIETGVRVLPITAPFVIVTPLAGLAAARVGERPPIVLGMVVVAVALYLLTGIDGTTTYADLWLPFVLLGIGVSLVMPPMSTAVMNSVSDAKAGAAAGMLDTYRQVGTAFGVAVLGAIFFSQAATKIVGLAEDAGLSAVRAGRLDDVASNPGAAADAIGSLPAGAARSVEAAIGAGFSEALAVIMWPAAGLALLGAVVALVAIRRPAAEAARPASTTGARIGPCSFPNPTMCPHHGLWHGLLGRPLRHTRAATPSAPARQDSPAGRDADRETEAKGEVMSR